MEGAAAPGYSEEDNPAVNLALNMGVGMIKEQVTSIGPRLKDDRAEGMRAMFRDFDKDGNGVLSRDELSRLLGKLGLSHSDISEIFSEADVNRNGVIEIDEFLNWLYPGNSDGSMLLDYGDALRPLFDAIDFKKTGTITQSEFVEVHSIMAGALRLNAVEDEKTHPATPLALREDSNGAFQKLDDNKSRDISFANFSKAFKDPILKSGISAEQLAETVKQLAKSLKEVFRGIKMAEAGEIRDEDSFILAGLISDLAESTKEFQEALGSTHTTQESSVRTKWLRKPESLTTVELKTLHMRCQPLNMRMVDKFDFEHILCVPMEGETADPEDHVWLGEVWRKVKYKNGVERMEEAHYYSYDRKQGGWSPMAGDQCDKVFLKVLKGLAPEIGMFYILRTNANFTLEIAWNEVVGALRTAVDIGWLTTEQRLQISDHIEQKVRDNISKTAAEPMSSELLDKKVMEYLDDSFVIRPRMVMAVITKLGIMQSSPTWSTFLKDA